MIYLIFVRTMIYLIVVRTMIYLIVVIFYDWEGTKK